LLYLATDEDAELAAQEEEEEALTLQKRLASHLDEEDFLTFDQVFLLLSAMILNERIFIHNPYFSLMYL